MLGNFSPQKVPADWDPPSCCDGIQEYWTLSLTRSGGTTAISISSSSFVFSSYACASLNVHTLHILKHHSIYNEVIDFES